MSSQRSDSPGELEVRNRLREVLAGAEYCTAACEHIRWRGGKSANQARRRLLGDLDFDATAIGFIADSEFGQDVGRRRWVEQNVDHIAARLDQATDPVGKIVGQLVFAKRIRNHG